MSDQEENTSKKSSWKKVSALIKDYFVNSDEKLIAWLLLIGAVLCVTGLVVLMATLGWWSAGFWAALAAKTLAPFLISMGEFTGILTALVSVHVIKNYLVGKLSILWRDWLTKKFIKQLFEGENNFIDLKRDGAIDNIDQRIGEDVKSFVDLTLNLGFDLLKSVLTLGVFVGSLWVVGGALSFVLLGLNIVIPGYLVWVALIIALVATVATHFIGKSLAETNQKAERHEADLRQEINVLNDEAENIAQGHAENYHELSIAHRLQEINETSTEKLNTQTKLVAVQNFYRQISEILPYVLSAPLYFTGLIELGQLMQIGMSFGQVSSSLSWFVETYEGLSKYETNIERITELQHAFEIDGLAANPKSIEHKVHKDKNIEFIKIEGLSIMPPQAGSMQYMMRNLNLTLEPHQHVLIKGPSGLGKSSLLRAISGSWKYGEGEITVPDGKSMYFLPQQPTFPKYDSLKASLAYPQSVDSYNDDQYKAVLNAVGDMDDFSERLDEVGDWFDRLSGGQRQRISFARVLLKEPDWLFLDEATSALDEKSQDQVYSRIKELTKTTIVSIAHRDVDKHHPRVINMSINADREIILQEDQQTLSLNL